VDENVAKYHASKIRSYFLHHNVQAKIVTFPGGEENKTIENYLAIVRELDSFPIHRRDEPIIAIGGGVLTDLVGFVASSYRRGLPHIKVPSTLMGYVDAAIGVKNGLNYNENKNRLGSFTPPLKVFLDRGLLKTLPRRHILNGICEIIKLAVIKDKELFSALEAYGAECADLHFQCEDGDRILDRAISSMLDELEPDFFEKNLARKVDFGHTFSYGLETRFEGRLFHGEAVLLDIAISTIIAKARGLISEPDTNRIFNLIEMMGLHLDTDILDPQLLWHSLEERVYHRNGLQRIPMPHGIGDHVFLNDVTEGEIKTAVSGLEEWVAVKHDII
jgi:3-dehydroquinate synthase